MHRLVVKSNLVDSGSDLSNLRFGVNDDPSPLCPKPRRLGVGAALPEFLKPPKCTKHNHVNTEGRSEILKMIAGKSEDLKDPVCIGCSSSCYSGSPPSRSNNPLVNDIEFIHQMELLSPFTRSKLSDQTGFTSASPV
ncbi:hypothetical protein AQUCO_00300006v1 [Aquilegia coerulea]|uniref:Uncharacterized protein n=1 Tax=Aquilegia coerulea TaxID=218851 RepID=A0A2G5EWV6_AQUCA|nr:hypothetical protein AQUCO_00300006v1 [Aquilegia coerulea]